MPGIEIATLLLVNSMYIFIYNIGLCGFGVLCSPRNIRFARPRTFEDCCTIELHICVYINEIPSSKVSWSIKIKKYLKRHSWEQNGRKKINFRRISNEATEML